MKKTNNEIFRKRFVASGLTSRELGERMGVAASSVRRWLCGARKISDAMLAFATLEIRRKK